MGFFERGVLLYLILGITIAMVWPQAIFDATGTVSNSSVLSWFNVGLDSTGNLSYNTVQNCTDTTQAYCMKGLGGSAVGNMTAYGEIPPGQSVIGLLDPLFQVWKWVFAVLKVLFWPITIMARPEMSGAPPAFMFIFAIPLTCMFIIGIVIWIRNGFT